MYFAFISATYLYLRSSPNLHADSQEQCLLSQQPFTRHAASSAWQHRAALAPQQRPTPSGAGGRGLTWLLEAAGRSAEVRGAPRGSASVFSSAHQGLRPPRAFSSTARAQPRGRERGRQRGHPPAAAVRGAALARRCLRATASCRRGREGGRWSSGRKGPRGKGGNGAARGSRPLTERREAPRAV